MEDKQRYDKEVFDCKKGIFMGRSQTPSIRIQNSDAVSTALEISDDLLEFLQVGANTDNNDGFKQENQDNLDENFEDYEEENFDENEFDDAQNNGNIPSELNPSNIQSNNLKVVIENFDEAAIRNRKDSLINPLA